MGRTVERRVNTCEIPAKNWAVLSVNHSDMPHTSEVYSSIPGITIKKVSDMSKPIKKPMHKWTDKAKKDATDKFAREAERLLLGGLSVEDLKDACDRALASSVTRS